MMMNDYKLHPRKVTFIRITQEIANVTPCLNLVTESQTNNPRRHGQLVEAGKSQNGLEKYSG